MSTWVPRVIPKAKDAPFSAKSWIEYLLLAVWMGLCSPISYLYGEGAIHGPFISKERIQRTPATATSFRPASSALAIFKFWEFRWLRAGISTIRTDPAQRLWPSSTKRWFGSFGRDKNQ